MIVAVLGKREIVSYNWSRMRARDGFDCSEGPTRYLLALLTWASYPMSPCFCPLVCEMEIKGRGGGVVILSGLNRWMQAGHLHRCPVQREESLMAAGIMGALCTGSGTFV